MSDVKRTTTELFVRRREKGRKEKKKFEKEAAVFKEAAEMKCLVFDFFLFVVVFGSIQKKDKKT